MRILSIIIALLASTATADTSQTEMAAQVERLGVFDQSATFEDQRVTTFISGCSVSIDTTLVAGEHAGKLDHRDSFNLAEVTFEDDGASPPNYGVLFLPDMPVDENTPINVNVRSNAEGGILRLIAPWKEPREPFYDGPSLNGLPYYAAPRSRGSFILMGADQRVAANAFVSALLAYKDQYCSGLS